MIMIRFASLAAVVGLALPLSAQQALEPEALTVQSGYGLHTFLVDAPDALSSPAARLNDARADRDGVVPPPTSGFVLHAALLVQTAQPGLLERLVGSIDERARVFAFPVTGTWLVEAPSVRVAVDLVAALEPVFGTGSVHLDARQPLTSKALPSDPGFGNQWHLRNTSMPEADANLEPAWNLGYTGSGVVVGVIDGGSQTGHPDLSANYNSTASSSGASSSHGTSVAGVIAADNDNGKGGVGAAYDAQWSNHVFGSSSTIANSFLYRNDINDVKNNSWGPYDDGTLSYMSNTERNALRDGVLLGRGGLGEIYTWAAGNGDVVDRVDYDPYASSRYTIAVGAVGDLDTRSWYNEKGSSMLVVAHSSGNNRGIYTTDAGSGYTNSFGGTSSAAPLGAGVVATVLAANPSLSWRDVQHILVHSARQCDSGHPFWSTNGSGHLMNYNYGFGAVDAGAATQLAASWTNVSAEQSWTSGALAANQTIPDNDPNGLEFTINVPQGITVEHVELVLNVTHGYVGDLVIWVKSPQNTKSTLSTQRTDPQDNLVDYIFTTVRSWDESSAGDWTFHISDESSNRVGTLQDYELIVYGNDGSHLDTFRVSTTGLVAGTSGSVDVDGARANENCWLAYSIAGLGSTSVPQLGVTLGLASPAQVGSAQLTDAGGQSTWVASVPVGSGGVAVWFQALQMNSVSSILATTIQ